MVGELGLARLRWWGCELAQAQQLAVAVAVATLPAVLLSW